MRGRIFLGWIYCFFVFVLLFHLPVFAATITIGGANAVVSGTASVPVYISGVTDMRAIRISIDYNNQILTLQGARIGRANPTWGHKDNSVPFEIIKDQAIIAMAGYPGVTVSNSINVDFLWLDFLVSPSTIMDSTYDVSVSVDEQTKAPIVEMADGSGGKITLAGPPADGTVYVLPGGAPRAYNGDVYTQKDNAVRIDLTKYALDGDDPDSGKLNYTTMSLPQNGIISGAPPNLTYSPNTGYIGPDSFTFNANDGSSTSNNAFISLYVTKSASPILLEVGSGKDYTTIGSAVGALPPSMFSLNYEMWLYPGTYSEDLLVEDIDTGQSELAIIGVGGSNAIISGTGGASKVSLWPTNGLIYVTGIKTQ